MNPGEAFGRYFYAAGVDDFLEAQDLQIAAELSRAHLGLYPEVTSDQAHAWRHELDILRTAFADLGPVSHSWSVLLECSLFRLGKRLDAVVLSPGVVSVIEFKIGATLHAAHHRAQTEDYALRLRDFHAYSQTRVIVPILCSELAPATSLQEPEVLDQVAQLLVTNATGLSEALRLSAASNADADDPADFKAFAASSYRPTPTIISAARLLYVGHRIADIGRRDAADDALQRAAEILRKHIQHAEAAQDRLICFVSGAPGAGKTLLGLDLALDSQVGGAPMALLSGNRPLVHVLTEALALDAAQRDGIPKGAARAKVGAAIQNLLGYLKEHTDGNVPPEHVIVFDEAQRAWDATVGRKVMKRPKSEPELFLDILGTLKWSCLVCLVGPGQEINRGEGGLPLWGEALSRAHHAGQAWRVLAAPEAIHGGPSVAGSGLADGWSGISAHTTEDQALHLQNSMRSYRNTLQGQWVTELLRGQLDTAKRIANEMSAPPALVARELDLAKTWLDKHGRGERSTGLLCSSGATRLVAEGIPLAPRSSELNAIGHWFLKPSSDFRSSRALELPMSEFGCQGLELDYTAVCWSGDLIWEHGKWVPRKMNGAQWHTTRQETQRRFRLNGYRVLLTRARIGSVIYVPVGDPRDRTRDPRQLDEIARVLQYAGCHPLCL